MKLDKYKYKMFPNIEDWTDPKDDMRNKNPNDMDFGDFMWFSPFAAKIIVATFFGFWVSMFFTLSIISAIKDSFFFSGVFMVIAMYIIFKPGKEYIGQYFVYNKNLYDLFLREY